MAAPQRCSLSSSTCRIFTIHLSVRWSGLRHSQWVDVVVKEFRFFISLHLKKRLWSFMRSCHQDLSQNQSVHTAQHWPQPETTNFRLDSAWCKEYTWLEAVWDNVGKIQGIIFRFSTCARSFEGRSDHANTVGFQPWVTWQEKIWRCYQWQERKA